MMRLIQGRKFRKGHRNKAGSYGSGRYHKEIISKSVSG